MGVGGSIQYPRLNYSSVQYSTVQYLHMCMRMQYNVIYENVNVVRIIVRTQDEAHGNACDRSGEGHSCIEHGKAAAAYSGHTALNSGMITECK